MLISKEKKPLKFQFVLLKQMKNLYIFITLKYRVYPMKEKLYYSVSVACDTEPVSKIM